MQEDVRSAVPRTSGSRQSEEEEEDDVGSHQEENDMRKLASSRGDAPQKPNHPHTWAGVTDADGGFGGLLSQLSVCVEDLDGEAREQLNRRMMVLDVLYLVHAADGEHVTP